MQTNLTTELARLKKRLGFYMDSKAEYEREAARGDSPKTIQSAALTMHSDLERLYAVAPHAILIANELHALLVEAQKINALCSQALQVGAGACELFKMALEARGEIAHAKAISDASATIEAAISALHPHQAALQAAGIGGE